MVNEKRIEKKIVALLVDAPKTTPEGKREYDTKDQQIQRFKRENPRAWSAFIIDLARRFQAFDEKITKAELADIDRFNASFRKPADN